MEPSLSPSHAPSGPGAHRWRPSLWQIPGWIVLAIQIIRAVLYPWQVADLETSADGFIYMQCGKNLIAHGLLAREGFWGCYWPPVWILVLSAIYRVIGVEATPARCFFAARLVNVVLWGAAIWLIWLLAVRLFDRRVAFWAVVLASLDTWFFYIKITGYEMLLIGLSLALTLAVDRLLDRPTVRQAIWTGLVLGIATLTQAKMLVVGGLYAALVTIRLGTNGLKLAIVYCLVSGLVIAPWTYRNRVVTGGKFIPVTCNGGMNLWQGNNPSLMAGRLAAVPPPAGFRPGSQEDEEPQFYRAALNYIEENPGRVLLKLVPVKLYLVWELDTWHHVVRLVLFVWGLARGLLDPALRRAMLLLLVPAVAITAVHTWFGVADSRYRFPAQPMVEIVLAWVLCGTADFVRGRRPAPEPRG